MPDGWKPCLEKPRRTPSNHSRNCAVGAALAALIAAKAAPTVEINMRNSKTINLDENRVITVQELRVKDVRQLLSGFTDLDKLNISALLGPRFAEISALVKPFMTFPEGESIDDLCGSELQLVIDGFKAVNIPFLILAGLDPAAGPKPPEPISTGSKPLEPISTGPKPPEPISTGPVAD